MVSGSRSLGTDVVKIFREPEGQLARWQAAVFDFDFDVLYRPDAKDVNADALSRIHMREPHECMQCADVGSEAITGYSAASYLAQRQADI